MLHVNGDDPEEVARATKILFDFRHKFKKDVCLDLNSYRLFGHNEQDEPRFTQPSMYKVIIIYIKKINNYKRISYII